MLCRNYMQPGGCPYGDRCAFLHPPMQQTLPLSSSMPSFSGRATSLDSSQTTGLLQKVAALFKKFRCNLILQFNFKKLISLELKLISVSTKSKHASAREGSNPLYLACNWFSWPGKRTALCRIWLSPLIFHTLHSN